MRDYSVIPTTWWMMHAKRIRPIGPRAIELALYLHSNPNINTIGLYYLPFPTILYECAIDELELRSLFVGLTYIQYAFYDDATQCVWLPDFLRIEVPDPKRPTAEFPE